MPPHAPNHQVARVCHAAGIRATVEQIQSLGNAGGFSGARLWRVTAPSDGWIHWCVRRWPDGTPAARIALIHTIIHSVDSQLSLRDDGIGRDILAVARRFGNGSSLYVDREDKGIYEVTRWLPGVADFQHAPDDAKLCAAMQTLAAWHLAASSVATSGPVATPGSLLTSERIQPYCAPSPGLQMRHRRCVELKNGKLAQIARAVQHDDRAWIARFAEPIVDRFTSAVEPLLGQLQTLSRSPWRQQWCLRDIWHDHVLFDGNRVTGLVDYDAIRIESATGDVARLLVSLARGDTTRFARGLQAYETLRTLIPEERELLSVWVASNAAMAGLQWLEWLCVDGRVFEDPVAVQNRLGFYASHGTGLC